MDDILRPKRPAKHDETVSVAEQTPTPVEDEPTLDVEETPTASETSETEEPAAPKPERKLLPAFFKRPWFYFRRIHLSRKQWIILSSCLVLVVAAGIWGGFWLHQRAQRLPKEASPALAKAAPKPKPTTGPSPLTGVTVGLDLTQRPVTGIMIENSPDARPQSGLKDAGVVYEAIAEGGITRFLALFQEAQPDYIGPVRSARPYYIDFLQPYDASYAHVGGSPDALALIKSAGIKDLDQFFNGDTYQRISQRVAPHNVYTSMAKLDALNQKKGYTSSKFTGFPRKKEAVSSQPTARVIDFNISAALYNPHYEYDTATNSYKRSEGGKPHVDERTGAQLAPKVVIAIVSSRGIAPDGEHTAYSVTGSGPVTVFQDGIQVTGTWEKPERGTQFSFKDSTGAAIKLNPGQTWISLVDSASAITYTP